MFDFKTIATSAITAVVVVVLAGLVGGNDQLGAGTRFPNGISADSTSPAAGEIRGESLQLDNGSATTSLIADKLCITGTESDGTAIYYYFGAGGDWATSSATCN